MRLMFKNKKRSLRELLSLVRCGRQYYSLSIQFCGYYLVLSVVCCLKNIFGRTCRMIGSLGPYGHAFGGNIIVLEKAPRAVNTHTCLIPPTVGPGTPRCVLDRSET